MEKHIVMSSSCNTMFKLLASPHNHKFFSRQTTSDLGLELEGIETFILAVGLGEKIPIWDWWPFHDRAFGALTQSMLTFAHEISTANYAGLTYISSFGWLFATFTTFCFPMIGAHYTSVSQVKTGNEVHHTKQQCSSLKVGSESAMLHQPTISLSSKSL